MVYGRRYPKPELTEEQIFVLREIRASRKEEKRRVIRAGIIPGCLDENSDDRIVQTSHVNKNTVRNTLSKMRKFGLYTALNDLPGPGKPKTISDDDRAWVLNLACTKHSEHGVFLKTLPQIYRPIQGLIGKERGKPLAHTSDCKR